MNITHILPPDTPVWLAMLTAQRESKMLLTNGHQDIISDTPVAGYTALRVRVKS